ncbi:MAG TPA: hypothetical protein VIM25_03320 [Candidatus Limnocylindrales bacterium]
MVVALMVATCGGTAAPSPSSTAEPTPTAIPLPTASPADVSAVFLKAITAPDFSAAETFSGMITVGGDNGSISGTGVMTGRDSSDTVTIRTSASSQVTSTISVGATTWSKEDPGPWLEDPKPATPKKGLDDYLHGLTKVVDLGLETQNGQKLHHLQAAAGNTIPPEFIGFASGANAKDGAFTIDFYATNDGTPALVVLEGTWTFVSGDAEAPASTTYNVALSDVGTPQTIKPPTDVWIRYHSKKGYTMAHPATSKVTSDKDKDTYSLSGQGHVYVAITAYKGTTTGFAAALKVSYRKPFGGDPTSETQRTLGGQAAIRLAYQYRNAGGQTSFIVDDVTTRGGSGWEVFLATPGGADDVAIFNQFAATFTFDP